jgi:hypothetical protein
MHEPMQAACRGVNPEVLSCTCAPHLRRICRRGALPAAAASCSGVALNLLEAWTSMPGCLSSSSAPSNDENIYVYKLQPQMLFKVETTKIPLTIAGHVCLLQSSSLWK